MNPYDLSEEEDLRLRFSIMLPGGQRSLYEYLCELPLEDLKAYPQKGHHWWMGSRTRTPQALALCDYILHWRLAAESFQQKYPRAYLETLPEHVLQAFLHTHISKVPIWAYETPVRNTLQILFHKTNPPLE